MTAPDRNDPLRPLRDRSGRWVYEDSLDALVPIDLIESSRALLRDLGYGDTDFIWEKARRSPSFVLRGTRVLAGVHANPGKLTLSGLEWYLDEREPGQEVAFFSAWGFSSNARSLADRLDIAMYRFTDLHRVEPFNKTALARLRRPRPRPGAPGLGPGPA